MPTDLELLAIDYRTLFTIDASGKIVRENDPDRSPGARFWLGGCAAGNVSGVHRDVPDDLATEILALAATEPPFYEPAAVPRHLDRYIELLSRHDGATNYNFGLIYQLPHHVQYVDGVVLIDSESDAGEKRDRSLADRGLPAGLLELGFGGVSDLWTPWCVAMHQSEIASIAFAARLSDAGAELGVATVPALRGRGHAAAATAGWSRFRSLRSRELFYSTDRTNVSSQRVATRLGLRPIGASLRISRPIESQDQSVPV